MNPKNITPGEIITIGNIVAKVVDSFGALFDRIRTARAQRQAKRKAAGK